MAVKNFFYWKLPVLLWCLIIMILTSYPKLSVPHINFDYMDKVAHLFVYFILAFLIIRAIVKKTDQIHFHDLCKTFYLAGAFAVLDEIHQIPIPGRSGDIVDALADILGILLALAVFTLMQKFSLKHKLIFNDRGEQ